MKKIENIQLIATQTMNVPTELINATSVFNAEYKNTDLVKLYIRQQLVRFSNISADVYDVSDDCSYEAADWQLIDIDINDYYNSANQQSLEYTTLNISYSYPTSIIYDDEADCMIADDDDDETIVTAALFSCLPIDIEYKKQPPARCRRIK